MTKTTKVFTIDYELIEKLAKVENKSGLVNQLLSEYFSKPLTEQQIQVDKELEELMIKKKEIMQQLAKHKETKILSNKNQIDEATTRVKKKLTEEEKLFFRVKEIMDNLDEKPKNVDDAVKIIKRKYPKVEPDIDYKWIKIIKGLLQ
jgi:hypothetical protein